MIDSPIIAIESWIIEECELMLDELF